MKNIIAALIMLAVLLAEKAAAADYIQTAGSSLTFSGKYQGEPFQGGFPNFTTVFRFDPARLSDAKLDVNITLKTATTRNADYDTELLGDSFFKSSQFPKARYTANAFRALGGNRFAADGLLSLRGVSKPVTLLFTWTAGAKPVLSGTATVKRLDFNVGTGDWRDVNLIPNDIKVSTKVVFQAKP
jgi:polyisoprenoid-binding protein YceI